METDRTRKSPTVTPERLQTSGRGLIEAQIKAARDEVSQLNLACLALSNKYNETALETGRDARLSFNQEIVQRDRETLESLFTEDYTFVDPFGVVGNRQTTVENILAGKIRKESFESVEENLNVHGNTSGEEALDIRGDTVVSTGVFRMVGSVRARLLESGEIRERDISGVYNSTHTYVRRNGRLQLAASHLTKQPDPKEFTHGPDEEEGVDFRT